MKNIDDLAVVYISEQTTPDDAQITNFDIEDRNGVFFAKFNAVLHSFHVLNRNRRMYDDVNTMDSITRSEEIMDRIRRRCWYGEDDHPAPIYESMKLTAQRVQKVLPEKRCILIIKPELNPDRSLLTSEIQTVAGSPLGIGMAKDMIQGLIPAFSARTIARMEYRDGKPYVSIKKHITYDKVDFPSHREAEMIDKPTIYLPKTNIALEHTSYDAFESVQLKNSYGKDIIVPITEFADFKEVLLQGDMNLQIIEAFNEGVTSDSIKGFDTKSSRVVMENDGDVLYVNVSKETVNKVHDFLGSYLS